MDTLYKIVCGMFVEYSWHIPGTFKVFELWLTVFVVVKTLLGYVQIIC